MDIVSAMRRSKETGERFRNAAGAECHWRDRDGFFFRCPDLLADDWESVPQDVWRDCPCEPLGLPYWVVPDPQPDIVDVIEVDGRVVCAGPVMDLPELQEHTDRLYRKLLDADARPDVVIEGD